MIRRFSVNFAIFSIFMDAFTVAFILWVTEVLRPILHRFLPVIKPVGIDFDLPVTLYVVFPLVWVIFMAFFSVYDGSKNLREVEEFTSLTLSSMLAGIALAGVLYLTYRETSRALFVIFGMTTTLALISWRLVARPFYRRRQAEEHIRHILIVDAGPDGLEVEKRLRQQCENELEFVGFLDDDPQRQSTRRDILGPVNDVRRVAREKQVNDVIVTLPLTAYARVNEIAEALQDLPVRAWIVPDNFQLTLHQARLVDFAGVPMFDLRPPALNEYQRLIKRLFDVVMTVLFLIPALPLMGISVLLIWIFDGRPILFKQKRAGENGRLFTVYKFRTMIRNADKMFYQSAGTDSQGNIIHKRRSDPRITPVGHFLRRFSFDELPQFFNVLCGDMRN
jgi:hypothetical protein